MYKIRMTYSLASADFLAVSCKRKLGIFNLASSQLHLASISLPQESRTAHNSSSPFQSQQIHFAHKESCEKTLLSQCRRLVLVVLLNRYYYLYSACRINPEVVHFKTTLSSFQEIQNGMSSPLTYYIEPCKDYALFEVDFEEPLYCEGVNPNDLHSSRKYRVVNLGTCGFMPDEHAPPNNDEIIQGIMSPTHDLTLPPFTREKAGISKDASTFAFIHPPPYLAVYLSEIGLGLDVEDVKRQLCIFSIFGAFIYFDDKMKIVGINILCPFKTDYELKLDGPYLTSDPALREVTKLKRFSLTPLEVYHEAGVGEKVSFHI